MARANSAKQKSYQAKWKRKRRGRLIAESSNKGKDDDNKHDEHETTTLEPNQEISISVQPDNGEEIRDH
jgi:hypothetical protein